MTESERNPTICTDSLLQQKMCKGMRATEDGVETEGSDQPSACIFNEDS